MENLSDPDPNAGFLPVKIEKSDIGNEFVENSANKTIPIRIIINDIKLDAPVIKAENNEISSRWSYI